MTGALSAQCMLRHWRQHLVRTQDTTGRATSPTARVRLGRHTAVLWRVGLEQHYLGAITHQAAAHRLGRAIRAAPRYRPCSTETAMSKERSHLPEVASVEGAWMRAAGPATAAVTARNGASGETDWEHYFGAVRRREWTVMAVTLLGTAVGLLASRLLHAPYSATALLWFETKDRAAGSRDPRASEGDELLNPSGWIDLVESNAVLEEVVRQRRLYLRPPDPADSAVLATPRLDGTPVPGAYRYAVDREARGVTLPTGGRVVQTHSLAQPVGRGLGFSWNPPPRGSLRRGMAYPLV